MKRFVPSLLLDDRGAWTSRNFKRHVYLGEPSNAVRIFNEMMADELSINWVGLDLNLRDNYLGLISGQASMPLSYSGNVQSVLDAKKIVNFGFERIGVSSYFINKVNLLKEISDEIGRSSLILKIPGVKVGGVWKFWDWKNSCPSDFGLVQILDHVYESDVGEICLISVDRNGLSNGPDKDLIKLVRDFKSTQLGYEGGISSIEDVQNLWKCGIDVVYSSTFLMLFGEYDAPLIHYPEFSVERYKN